MVADPKAYMAFFPVAERQADRVLPLFQAELAKKAPAAGNEASRAETAKDRLAERQARAAVALVRMGKAEGVWPLLRHSPDPRLRSFIINWLSLLECGSQGHRRGIRPHQYCGERIDRPR